MEEKKNEEMEPETIDTEANTRFPMGWLVFFVVIISLMICCLIAIWVCS